MTWNFEKRTFRPMDILGKGTFRQIIDRGLFWRKDIRSLNVNKLLVLGRYTEREGKIYSQQKAIQSNHISSLSKALRNPFQNVIDTIFQ